MTLSERLEKVADEMPMARDGYDLHTELRSIAAEVASAQLDAADMVRINANLLATQERLYKEIAELKADLVMKTRFAPTTDAAKQKLLEVAKRYTALRAAVEEVERDMAQLERERPDFDPGDFWERIAEFADLLCIALEA